MRERVRQDKQLLTKLIAAVLAVGRKSIATCLSKKYGKNSLFARLVNNPVIHSLVFEMCNVFS